MTVKKTETIDPDFLSNTDKNYLMEIVTDWLADHSVEGIEEVAYSITVEWKEQG
jgi:hypothetical protein